MTARQADRALFDTVVAQARAAKTSEQRAELLSVLGMVRDPALVTQALALVVDKEFDLRDSSSILRLSLSNPYARDQAWAFYQAHFDELAPRMRSDELGHLIGDVRVFCDEPHRAQVEAFLRPRAAKIEGGTRALDRALEASQLCIVTERRHQPSVLEFLRARVHRP